MIEETPEAVREALIESVPILIGRADANGLVLEIEGSVPKAGALGPLIPERTNLLELLSEDAEEVQAALRAGETRLLVQTTDEEGPAHFEVRIIHDRRRGGGAYFLVHDVTETRQLQIALLNCTDHEQIRIGQELHDTLGQELTGVAYRLHSLRELTSANLAEAVDALQEQISSCLKQSRDIAFKLSPHIEGKEIVGAFERLSAHISNTFDLTCVFTHNLEKAITDQGVAFHLFRIAQEACTNAVRHGNAHRIDIRLVTGRKNQLEISDDGIGIDNADISEIPGMGIPTMKFRAEAIGGALRVSRPGASGTTVRCHFESQHDPDAETVPSEESCETCS